MSPLFEDGDHADVEPAYDAPPFEGLTELHVKLYRVLVGCSHPGKGGYPVARANQDTLAAQLGVSVPTVQRLIADLRTPEPDRRKPKAKPAGRRWGWLRVVVRREQRTRKGGAPFLVGNDYVLLLSWAEVAGFKAAPNRRAGRRSEPMHHNSPEPEHQKAARNRIITTNRSIAAEAPKPAGRTEASDELVMHVDLPTGERATALNGGRGSPAIDRARRSAVPQLPDDLLGACTALQRVGLLHGAKIIELRRSP